MAVVYGAGRADRLPIPGVSEESYRCLVNYLGERGFFEEGLPLPEDPSEVDGDAAQTFLRATAECLNSQELEAFLDWSAEQQTNQAEPVDPIAAVDCSEIDVRPFENILGFAVSAFTESRSESWTASSRCDLVG